MDSNNHPPTEVREPTEEEVRRLVHADEEQILNSPDVPQEKKNAILDFYREKLKEADNIHKTETTIDGVQETPRTDSVLLDPRITDAKYKSFPSFSDWSKCIVDESRWAEIGSLKVKWNQPSEELLQKARSVVTRAAAVDTGALEQLYEVDRGFTFTVATQAATWQAALDTKGPEVRALIESQMEAYEMVLDFATKQQPIVEAWIRELHREICKSQKNYRAITELGPQELPLPLGQYKTLPNHVYGRDGKVHAYAPVEETFSEMHKLTQVLSSKSFSKSHPILQASYAHYAFILVHPFADGNGRVARALASVFTYRAESVPLLILSENRNAYLESLSAADNGDFQPFINFILERTLDAIRLAGITLMAATAPQLEQALQEYQHVFITKGGYTHEEVDAAGYRLVDLITEELKERSKVITASGNIKFDVNRENRNDYKLEQPQTTRVPVSESGRRVNIELTGVDARQPRVTFRFDLAVPKDCDIEDEVLISPIRQPNEASMPIEAFSARITELIPEPSAALRLRIRIFVEAVLGILVKRLADDARSRLHAQGF